MPSRAEEFQHCRVFSPDQMLFPQISYTSFVYPGDQEALAALKRVPGAPSLLTYLQKNFTEEVAFVENSQQMIRANSQSFFSLHKLVVRCSEILSCPVPDVYIANSPIMNAYTTGHRHTCIVLNSALIEAMTVEELAFVVGHEIGHIKCGHGLYRQLGDILLRYWDVAASAIGIPGIGLIRIPLLIAYWEWFRRAELTCDRAGLLCLQSPQPALAALGKLAGKVDGLEEEFNIESAISQAGAHTEVGKLAYVVSIFNNLQNTHPFIPVRLKEVSEYSKSTDYRKMLQGEYERDPLGLHEGGIRATCECGEEVNIKFSHCPKCGRALDSEAPSEAPQLAAACGKCGTVLTDEMKFCPKCGSEHELAGVSPKPVGPFGIFRRR